MDFRSLSRRGFIKATLLGAITLFGAGTTFGRTVSPEELPTGRLSLYNTHSGERLRVIFRDSAGNYDLDALNALNWALRCHYTNEATEMDLNTLEFLNLVDNSLGGDNEIHIISGYRSPAYNGLLRSNGRGVARNSLHLSGKAIDIAIPGKNIASVRQAAVSLRLGGVGYYPGKGFVHIDSGNFRTW